MEAAEDSEAVVVVAAVMEAAEVSEAAGDSEAVTRAVDSAAAAWVADLAVADLAANMPAQAPWEGSAAPREGSEVPIWAASAGPNYTAPALAATTMETTTLAVITTDTTALAAITMDAAALAETSSAVLTVTSRATTTTVTTTPATTPMTAHASSIGTFTPPPAGGGVRSGSATELAG